ncbi:hypothetical protein [Pseudonocardia endophytica]|uniref:hypothetical protein n=1 Tax=Pseudonocardia endophytica TaxID=401976 RepID=UPI00104E299E|nr:hypothetical protein [Pseudonocardia endophytica]
MEPHDDATTRSRWRLSLPTARARTAILQVCAPPGPAAIGTLRAFARSEVFAGHRTHGRPENVEGERPVLAVR